ncbi:hypothetical protein JB92DRAFT_3099652 [Gautieria morchelliformis]|nr:hypothetical protein JB92DRAFT_3099652 [Gautieria morchelliformis]
MAEASTTTTPSTFGMMSLTSPLTRAFRKSDNAKYSEDSDEIDDEADEGQEQHTVLATSIWVKFERTAYPTHLSVVTSSAAWGASASGAYVLVSNQHSASSTALAISSPRSSSERSENKGLLRLDCASVRSNHVLGKGVLTSGGGGGADEVGKRSGSEVSWRFIGLRWWWLDRGSHPPHPPVHMQYALHPCLYRTWSREDVKSHRVGISGRSTLSMKSIRPLKPSEYDPSFAGCLYALLRTDMAREPPCSIVWVASWNEILIAKDNTRRTFGRRDIGSICMSCIKSSDAPDILCLLAALYPSLSHGGTVGQHHLQDSCFAGAELAQWITIKNFLLVTQGKAILQLYGEGDLTGRDETFSSIQVSMKVIFMRADEDYKVKLAKAENQPKSQHRYNIQTADKVQPRDYK